MNKNLNPIIPNETNIEEGRIILQNIIKTTPYTSESKNIFLKSKLPDDIMNIIYSGNIQNLFSCIIWESQEGIWDIGLCFIFYNKLPVYKKFILLNSDYKKYEDAYSDMVNVVKQIISGFQFVHILKNKIIEIPEFFYFYNEKITLEADEIDSAYNVIKQGHYLPYYKPEVFEKEINKIVKKAKKKKMTYQNILTDSDYSKEIVFYCYILALSGYTRYPLLPAEKENNII